MNADIDFSSHFYYKKPAVEVMFAGPCWDYDKSFGCSRKRDWNDTILTADPSYICWDLSLVSDEIYDEYLHDTFGEFYEMLYRVLNDNIDQYYDRIHDSIVMDRIRWDRGPSRMYEDSDNDIRYLKLFLNKRMDHLAEECGVNERQGNMSLENESMHKITLHKENGEETLFVLDGTLLNVTDLPSYDNRIYDGY